MNDGSQFVETLKKLNYPKASELKGEDFDWLFESPEHRCFLRWFCSSVNKENVLSEEEVTAFQALRELGKPILDEAALVDVLKTCQSEEPRRDLAFLEELGVEQLEEELQALRREKKRKMQRLRRLQVMTTASADTALRLTSQEKEASVALRETVEALGAENAKTNHDLQILEEEVKKLTTFFSPGAEQEAGTQSQPPVFLSQLPLETYLHQEELNTKALTSFTQKQFFQGISDLVESSNEENFRLLDLSSSSAGREDGQVQQGHRKEMARLQCAHSMAQYQLIQATAQEHSIRAGLQWIDANASTKLSGSVQDLEVRAARLRKELEAVQSQVQTLQSEQLPAAVRESAQLLNVPVVRGDIDLQIARQDYYTSRQDEVCCHLLRQKASFDLLQLGYELELKQDKELHKQLEDLVQHLESRCNNLSRRLETFSSPELAVSVQPRSIIHSKDTVLCRLYQALEGKATQEQPFRTYEGLQQAALALQQELQSVREAIASAEQEQAYSMAKMEADSDVLRSTNYCGLKQLVLTPQELGERLLHLEAQLNKLNQLMQEIGNDIRTKKSILERKKLLRKERKLYDYFFQDEDYLKSTIRDLEDKVRAVTIGQAD
ncbi:HAUS augmin-like complex subunit 3 isoform X2 [Amia ocellicauda]|uniref:HAUS augmin-like complex subunit 3 isoform X2 n=1 Tax=Amia ocellicauda TaxID=2972642 RepID=UPI0034641EB9